MELGIFEQPDDTPTTPRLPEAVDEWARGLLNARKMDEGKQVGALTWGVDFDDHTAVALYVTPGTDLTDNAIYPEEIAGLRVVYRYLPPPISQSPEAQT